MTICNPAPRSLTRTAALVVKSRAQAFVAIVVGLFGELSDQRAYARFLETHRLTHSADAWRRFSEGRLRRKFSQGRCC